MTKKHSERALDPALALVHPHDSTAPGPALRRATLLFAAFLFVASFAHAEPASRRGVAPLSPPAQTGFSLGLEVALPVDGLSMAHYGRPGEAAAPAAAAERSAAPEPLRLPDVGEVVAAYEAQRRTSSDRRMPRWGGAGRWLKRHWWVPVLGAAAIAYAIDESDGDDDRFGEDD